MAFSKIAGLEVTPRNPSFSTSAFNSPEVIRLRRMLSYQTLWPCLNSSTRGFFSSTEGLAISLLLLQILGFNRLDFRQAPRMTLFAGVASSQESLDAFASHFFADNARA